MKLIKDNKRYFVPEDDIFEGKLITTVTKTRKRSAKLRAYAFDYYKKINQIKCDICGFDFEENYGVTITYLTDEELKGFVETVRPVQEYFIKKFGKEACAAWGLE